MTNHSKLQDEDKTGWYLPEVAHPHHVLTDAGFEIVYVSPKGGKSPMVIAAMLKHLFGFNDQVACGLMSLQLEGLVLDYRNSFTNVKELQIV